MVNRINNEILKYFPVQIRNVIVQTAGEELNNLREIRVRLERPIILKLRNKDLFVKEANREIIVNKEMILRIFESVCSNSIYAFGDEISNGFITVFGGHRVGIVGKPLYREGKIYTIKDISSMNFRIARQIIGAGDRFVSQIKVNGRFANTLIVSLPGLGKTTLLRDLVRQISNSGCEVSLIDERSEIAACFMGVPQNDIGIRTDVMDNVTKSDGIKMMVRSMRPDFIATDEIGTFEDIEAIKYAINAGVRVIATAHGESLEDVKRNGKMREIIELKVFKKIIILKENDVKIIEF